MLKLPFVEFGKQLPQLLKMWGIFLVFYMIFRSITPLEMNMAPVCHIVFYEI